MTAPTPSPSPDTDVDEADMEEEDDEVVEEEAEEDDEEEVDEDEEDEEVDEEEEEDEALAVKDPEEYEYPTDSGPYQTSDYLDYYERSRKPTASTPLMKGDTCEFHVCIQFNKRNSITAAAQGIWSACHRGSLHFDNL